jgi:hypothetical protein
MLQPMARQSFAASRIPRCSRRPAHRLTVDGSGENGWFVQLLPRCWLVAELSTHCSETFSFVGRRGELVLDLDFNGGGS